MAKRSRSTQSLSFVAKWRRWAESTSATSLSELVLCEVALTSNPPGWRLWRHPQINMSWGCIQFMHPRTLEFDYADPAADIAVSTSTLI